jgi:hypothetical protein
MAIKNEKTKNKNVTIPDEVGHQYIYYGCELMLRRTVTAFFGSYFCAGSVLIFFIVLQYNNINFTAHLNMYMTMSRHAACASGQCSFLDLSASQRITFEREQCSTSGFFPNTHELKA